MTKEKNMLDVIDIKDHYLEVFSRFEKELEADEDSPMHRLRESAIGRFAELGFPTAHDEEWRFTNIATLTRLSFGRASTSIPKNLTVSELDILTFGNWDCHRLVFVNGALARELSDISKTCGFELKNLREALHQDPRSVETHLAKYADCDDHAFVALNTAFLDDGAFIRIPKNFVVEKPIHLMFVSTAGTEPAMAHPRLLLVAEPNSQATVVESYLSLDSRSAFTNAVTEIVLGENAAIDHYKVERQNRETFHVATLQVQQNRGSCFSSHSITTGGALARNDVNAVLDGEGCECTLNGLYMATDKQLIDNHTRIDHAKPHCTSHELYKGILDGQARGVFNGKIYVHQDAQKTDAKQTNKTLLLSEDAVINTKPQLEIFADDVKCTHGATVGQLAEEAIFYLRSRGIGREDARSLLTFAFANDIIGRIKVEPVRRHLEEMLLAGRSQAEREEIKEAP
jgi:Fe-S cluster assembly protein SufD